MLIFYIFADNYFLEKIKDCEATLLSLIILMIPFVLGEISMPHMGTEEDWSVADLPPVPQLYSNKTLLRVTGKRPLSLPCAYIADMCDDYIRVDTTVYNADMSW